MGKVNLLPGYFILDLHQMRIGRLVSLVSVTLVPFSLVSVIEMSF